MSSQEVVGLEIYDMYVLNNSGLPVFAGCTTSDYCMQHAEQHPLHTGFLAALLSFGKEVFSGDLQKLNFPNIKINIKTQGEYTFVFVNPESEDDDLILTKIDEMAKLFRDKYEKDAGRGYVTDEQFDNFNDDMIAMGLIPKNKFQSTKAYFITDEGESEKKSKSLFGRFKQKFTSLVKK